MESLNFLKYPYAESGHQYALDVISGKVKACKWIKLQARRHLNDIKKQNDPNFEYYFSPEHANRMGAFASLFKHVKGKWATSGESIKFEPWQNFAFGIPFGWLKKSNNKRRYRNIFALIPRKNGKSLCAAIVGLYMLTIDGEPGSEVYCGASNERQAWEVFKPARLMANGNEKFKEAFRLHVGAKNIHILDTASKFEPVIGNPGDGSSPHCAIADEGHEHLDSRLIDSFQTGMGAREQPILLEVSTAGFKVTGPCYSRQKYVEKILEGILENNDIWGIIYTIDQEDDWTDFSIWKKANPNFGISVFEDFLLAQYKESMQVAEAQNKNLCKHLNIWSNSSVGWINMAKWEECTDSSLKIEDFTGEKCWIGLDLARRTDLAALVVLFKQGRDYFCFAKHYLPRETVERPENSHYRKFEAQEFLTVTPGARTDFDYIEEDLKSIHKKFKIIELGYDPKEAENLMQDTRVWADFPCVEINQSALNISEPMKELEALYLSKQLHIAENPVMRWEASNVILKNLGRTKYFMPSKENIANKIDGIVALIMALSRCMAYQEEPDYSQFLSQGVYV